MLNKSTFTRRQPCIYIHKEEKANLTRHAYRIKRRYKPNCIRIGSFTLHHNGSLRLRLSSLFSVKSVHSSTSKRVHFLHTHHLDSSHCKDIRAVKQLHAYLITSYNFLNASKLISLYAQFNDICSANLVFERLNQADTFSWNSIIKAHVDNNLVDSAFSLYKSMRRLGVVHDTYTFPIINRVVLLHEDRLLCAQVVHCLAIRMGFELDLYFSNTMIDVYVKCGKLGFAIELFDGMPVKDLVSWTSMISGYVRERNVYDAFMFLNGLRMEFEPNYVTVMVMFQVCCDYAEGGKQLHGYALKCGLLMRQSVYNSVLKMYTDTRCVDDAENLFGEFDGKDVVSWNIMISFYSSRWDVMKLADCVHAMQDKAVFSIETLTLLVSSFSESENAVFGKQVHCLGIKSGQYDSIIKTSLLDTYAKCEELDSSEKLFSEISCTNHITLNAMMSAYIRNGYFTEAIELVREMLASGLKPAAEPINKVIIAYSHMGSLLLGKSVHAYCFRNLLEDNIAPLETSILNMYVRCGSIISARICFDRMVSRDLVAWTSMIEGFGTHGLGCEAVECFHSMLQEGIEPNSVTFLGILSACSHSGLLRYGCRVLCSMKSQFGIEPDLSHYTCIVDLLGRFGMLKEALAIILKLVTFADSRIWGALMSACRVHDSQLLAEFAAKMLFQLEPENAGYHTLLSNVQASSEGWSEVEEIRDYVQDSNLIKQPGWSCIEANGLINGFVAGDRSHPRVLEIYETLFNLSRKLQTKEPEGEKI